MARLWDRLRPEPFPILKTWEPGRVLKLQSLMVDFFRTDQGLELCHRTRALDLGHPITDLDSFGYALEHARVWAEFAPIWMDPAYVDMAIGAAALLPSDAPFHPQDLLSPNGCIVFAEEVRLDDLVSRPISGTIRRSYNPDRPVRALTWETKGTDFAHLKLWFDPHTSILQSRPYLDGTFVIEMPFTPSDIPVARFLQAIAAITRTDKAVTDQAPLHPSLRRAARATGIASPGVRRFYLARPEEGRFERDAALDRQGARLHWVSGHWRNQPYPSEGVTRAIFIAGHLRGSAELGVVSGPRLGIARGPVLPPAA